ncbi:hypothetical protein ACFXK0_12220 [Nocardia sp. NPDC059177]|uniref:hypothetical protein n=1 Tax=Nocardia sp. NPDC059177 TaxID=3346759 RepID=UPI0036C20C0A
MAIGQQAAAQLRQAADSGELTMEPNSAREVAQAYLRFAAQCDGWIDQAADLGSIHGFGSFVSAQQLQQGFARKAESLYEVLTELARSARGMAEGYLRAANILAEVDELNAAALRTASGAV